MFNNPIFEDLRNIYYYILFWIVIYALYFLLLLYQLNVGTGTAVIDSLVFNTILGSLGLSYWYAARFISIDNRNKNTAILSHITGALSATIIWLVSGYYIIITIIGSDAYKTFFMATLPWRFLIGLLFYFLINAFYYIIIYYNTLQEKAVREVELKNLITEAELKSLKFQINPHFIFNSLNSMSALTTIDPDKAREMILKLAEFLRYTLANNEKQENLLSDEIKNLKLYLDIEKIRFEDKFEFVSDIDVECDKAKVPNMILQPLFENAIKHAVYDSLEKVTIRLYCKCENNFLKICVENNFEKSGSHKKGAGIGLQNIKNRLSLIYGRDNLMEIDKGEDKFKVILYIPL